MDSITFKFPIKPFSINSMYYRDRSIISKDAREWQQTIMLYLEDSKIQEDIKTFSDGFKPKEHALRVNISHYYPRSELIASAGHISSRSFDLSNIEKPLIDLLTSKNYSTKKCKNLQIDDKFIVEMISKKGIAETYLTNVKFERVPQNDIEDLTT